MYIDKSRQRVANDSTVERTTVLQEGVVDRESKRIGGRQALAQGQGATGVHGSAARPRRTRMWRMANPSDNPSDDDDWEGGVDPEKDWEPPDWLR